MVRLGRGVQSCTDYILSMYRHLFRNVSIWDPRHYSYHYLMLGCIRSATLMEHTKYLGGFTWIPLRPPTILTI